MRTCCPTCRTVFRVTSEQLRLRAGKVRCGQCRAVFNAIENLFDGDSLASSPPAPVAAAAGATPPLPPATRASARTEPAPGPTDPAATAPAEAGTSAVEDVIDIATLPASVQGADEPAEELPPADRRFPDAAADDHSPPGTADDLSAPSQWAAEVPGAPSPAERSARLTFIVVAILLACVLAGQIVFHQRGSIAISAPTLRPLLEGLSTAFGSAVPLPRQAELVSIESSDLQADPGRDKLLVLQATLRNRAAYAQAYPALELTLTDTRDKAIARRVLLPEDYLSPAALENGPFPTNAEMEVKIWLEARQIDAAGYRLYVFYP